MRRAGDRTISKSIYVVTSISIEAGICRYLMRGRWTSSSKTISEDDEIKNTFSALVLLVCSAKIN